MHSDQQVCFPSEGQRVPCSLLQSSEEHLAWSLPGASCVTLGKFLTSLILCFLIFVVGTKCIIACEAFQRSPGWDGALNWCLSTRLQCLEMISEVVVLQTKSWPNFRRVWGCGEDWGEEVKRKQVLRRTQSA